MNYIALDTETTLIPERTNTTSRSGSTIYTSPFVVPDLVLGSVSDGAVHHVWEPRRLQRLILDLLPDTHLVFHNSAFDYHVLTKAFPDLRPVLDNMIETGRVHDTMYLDLLYGLATGYYDRAVYNPSTKTWQQPDLRSRSLEKLAKDLCNVQLDKDPSIRLTYGQYLGWDGEPNVVSKAHVHYAAEDARATWLVFDNLRRRIEAAGLKNWLSENTQIKAAIAFSDLDQRGVHINRRLAGQLYTTFERDLLPLQHKLVELGHGSWQPAPGSSVRERHSLREKVPAGEWMYTLSATLSEAIRHKLVKWKHYKKHSVRFEAEPKFKLSTAVLQSAVNRIDTGSTAPPRRADGTVSLQYDYWAENIPADHPLQTWLEHEKLKKILSTYLSVYRQVDSVFPRWYVLGARSGRMSASGPSVQNVPKRKHGIRALFVPSPGHVFVKADYTAQEMYTLADSMLRVFEIDGPLLQVLKSGKDIHTQAAALVLKKDPAEVTKQERQSQKALSFGVPGGLGPKKLADYAYGLYGLKWTKDEAKAARDRFLEAFPDIEEFLLRMKRGQDHCLREVTGRGVKYWKEHLEIDHWNVIWKMTVHHSPDVQRIGREAERVLRCELPSGRVRANCRFTEAANSYFQGPASDVLKEAAWLARQAGLKIVLAVHDEIVVESRPDLATEHAKLLEASMLSAFRNVCSTVGDHAKVEVTYPLYRWGPATDSTGKEIT